MTVQALEVTSSQLEMVDMTPTRVEVQDVVVGPQGLQGERGIQGLRGIRGADGTDGAAGGDGADGNLGAVLAQLVPLATWTWTHTIGRLPAVTVYDATGELVEPDVHASTSAVTVVFPSPATGTVVLT